MGIVYVLTNPAFPGLLKIGHTVQPLEKRMKSLHSTGLPEPYKCVAAWEFEDHKGAERALHAAFADFRHSRGREFFEIKPDRVLAILEQFGTRDVTPPAGPLRHIAPTPPRKKPFRFSMLDIAPGETLSSIWDDSVTCTVVDDQNVEFAGDVMSLSAAAETVARGRGKTPKALRGPACWRYGDPPKTLAALRDLA